METDRKLSILCVFFSYGGHSGMDAEHPSCREWLCDTMSRVRDDPRVGKFGVKTLADTPVTMSRNKAVKLAREMGVDILVMLDADQDFMLHADEDWYRPFFPVAFDEIYKHYDKGPLVIAAPYCGAANNGENIFYFRWQDQGWHGDETSFSLEQYTRAEAAEMRGLHEAAALPTGLIMFDMRIFDLLDVNRKSKEQVLLDFQAGKIGLREALRCIQDGYFYYEWTDETASEKASTEDVSATRDMSIVSQLKLGYNACRVACDSWIGHVKPYTVGRPKRFCVEQVGGVLKRTVLDGHSYRDEIRKVSNPELLKLLESSNGSAA